jgi:hypothetical protein
LARLQQTRFSLATAIASFLLSRAIGGRGENCPCGPFQLAERLEDGGPMDEFAIVTVGSVGVIE